MSRGRTSLLLVIGGELINCKIFPPNISYKKYLTSIQLPNFEYLSTTKADKSCRNRISLEKSITIVSLSADRAIVINWRECPVTCWHLPTNFIINSVVSYT